MIEIAVNLLATFGIAVLALALSAPFWRAVSGRWPWKG